MIARPHMLTGWPFGRRPRRSAAAQDITLLDCDARSPQITALDIPTTAAGWIALGYAAPSAVWLCDEAAGDFVDEIAGLHLIANASAPQGARGHGIAGSSGLYTNCGEVTAEASAQQFYCADPAALAVGASVDFHVLLLVRPQQIWTWAGRVAISHASASRGWAIQNYTGAEYLDVYLQDSTGYTTRSFASRFPLDRAYHLIDVAVDRDNLISVYVDALATVTAAAARPGDLTQAVAGLKVLNDINTWSIPAQIAAVAIWVGTANTRAGHDALYLKIKQAGYLSLPAAVTRATVVQVPIAAERVAGFGPGVVAPSHCHELVDGTNNPLGMGLLCEEGLSCMGINSANMPGWTASSATITAIDGPSGMRDAIRVQDSSTVAAGCAYSAWGAITGASNVQFSAGVRVRNVAGAAYLVGGWWNGDPGGAEYLDLIGWPTADATWQLVTGTATPTRAAHASACLRLYPTSGSNPPDTGTIEFAEPYLIQGRSHQALAYRAVGSWTAASTAASIYKVTNDGSKYNPDRGTIEWVCAGYDGAPTGTYREPWDFRPAAGNAGRAYVYHDDTTTYVKMHDSAGTERVSLSWAQAPLTQRYRYRVRWNSARTIYSTGGTSYHAVLEEYTGGAWVVRAYGTTAAWTPAAAATVTDLYIGSGGASATTLRGWIERLVVTRPTR